MRALASLPPRRRGTHPEFPPPGTTTPELSSNLEGAGEGAAMLVRRVRRALPPLRAAALALALTTCTGDAEDAPPPPETATAPSIATPSPSPTPEATSPPTPTATPSPAPTETPAPTPTPSPTETPAPTPTDEQRRIQTPTNFGTNTRVVDGDIHVWHIPTCPPVPPATWVAPVILTDLRSGSILHLDRGGSILDSPAPVYHSDEGRKRLTEVVDNNSLMDLILAPMDCP